MYVSRGRRYGDPGVDYHLVVPYLIIAAIAGLGALALGLAAATANPTFIGLAAGATVGLLLLAKPEWNIWLILLLGLVVAGVLPIWVEGFGSKAVWGVAVLGFVLLSRALFAVVTTPSARRATPGFVWMALAFFLYAVLSSLLQWSSPYEFLSGVKRYFQALGLLFAFAWVALDERHIARWRQFIVVVAVLQLPWAVYELIKLVPARKALSQSVPGIIPIDVVAGTFGASMYSGGASAEMATFLLIVLAFLLARRREQILGFGRLLALAPFVLAPVFLGETKVIVILLPLMFLTLYRRELLARPHYGLAGLMVGALLTMGAGYAYLSLSKKSLNEQVADTLRYNVYETGYGGYALNRTTVLSFWAARQGPHDPAASILGSGLGTAHERTGGHLGARYAGYGISLTAASTLLWEQGVLGALMFLGVLGLAWRAAGRLQREAQRPWMRADAAAIQAAMPMFAFYLIYRSALLEGLPFQILFYSLLGYLAWMHRQHSVA